MDNGSDVNPVPNWQKKFPEIQFIRSDINLGFAGGNNLGTKAAKGDYLFFVNNDTEFTTGLIGRLVWLLENNNIIGIVSPKIRYYDDKTMLQYAGYTPMNYLTARTRCIGFQEKDNGQYDDLTGPTGFGHGAAMMIPKRVIEKVGLMAENYFLYFEELDWFERIKKGGFQVWICPEALIYHKESMSVGKRSSIKEYFMNRNRLLFIRRNTNLFNIICFYLYFILLVTPRNILTYIRNREFNFIPLIFKSIYWNFTNDVNSFKR